MALNMLVGWSLWPKMNDLNKKLLCWISMNICTDNNGSHSMKSTDFSCCRDSVECQDHFLVHYQQCPDVEFYLFKYSSDSMDGIHWSVIHSNSLVQVESSQQLDGLPWNTAFIVPRGWSLLTLDPSGKTSLETVWNRSGQVIGWTINQPIWSTNDIM